MKSASYCCGRLITNVKCVHNTLIKPRKISFIYFAFNDNRNQQISIK